MLIVPWWQSISSILSDRLETIQKRALKIVFPSAETYLEVLQLAGIDNLADRRTIIYVKKYMNKMKRTNHPLHALLPKSEDKNCIYELRDRSCPLWSFEHSGPMTLCACVDVSVLHRVRLVRALSCGYIRGHHVSTHVQSCTDEA